MQFDGSLTDFISQKTQMERSYVLELLAFGCIYVGQYQDVRALSARKKPISKIQRTVQDIMPIQPCTYIRVHVNPHRFPSALRQDWSCRIVALRDDFVVVDKPSGVPSVSTLDNLHENVKKQVEIALNLNQPLHAVSRLDVCTSGLIIYARNAVSAKQLCKLISDRELVKEYTALATGWLPVGQLRHKCRKKAHDGIPKPRIYRAWVDQEETDDQWQDANLQVLSSRAFSEKLGLFEVQVQLETGRTHQIRLQAAAEGSFLLGDTRYAPVNGMTHSGHSSDDTLDRFGPEPDEVALQASRLEFQWKGSRLVFEAGKPWWHFCSEKRLVERRYENPVIVGMSAGQIDE